MIDLNPPKKLNHIWTTTSSLLHSFLLHANPFWIELSYFVFISSLGFFFLKASLKPNLPPPRNIDVFFTSVSATTVSSMSTVDMEVFSNSQHVLITFMMFVGGEVFTSMLGLQLTKSRMSKKNNNESDHESDYPSIKVGTVSDQTALEETKVPGVMVELDDPQFSNMKLKSIKSLSLLVLCYLFVVHLAGSIAIALYLVLIPSARKVLTRKGLSLLIFPIFTTVSSFSNCGFIPTNENMVVFKQNSGLLLIIIPQILMGNTFYPIFLWLSIWIAEKLSKRKEFRYMQENSRELGYGHLLTGMRCSYLGITGLGFIVLQLVSFCSMEWHSAVTGGLNGYQRFIASLFQVVNSRHSGEMVFDLSAVSSAVLVLFIFMMYLPPYTSYLPIDEDDNTHLSTTQPTKNNNNSNNNRNNRWANLIFSQLTYLTIFIILICITERHSMKTDPLNFNVLNVVVEVISAYGNVGFSTGYSCGRQISPDRHCKDASYGFAGRWSSGGKFVLTVVMLFGRLKKFSLRGGKAWRLQ